MKACRAGAPRRALGLALLAVAGCASTTTTQLLPAPQAPVCDRDATAQILWTTRWRADQKDVDAREAAAAEGLGRFFAASGCFAGASVRRVPGDTLPDVHDALATAGAAGAAHGKVVVITVRELGPTVKIGASLALVEGATEVVLDIAEHTPAAPLPRTFSVQWRDGGPGVLKGVATLPQDLQAALTAALQPAAR